MHTAMMRITQDETGASVASVAIAAHLQSLVDTSRMCVSASYWLAWQERLRFIYFKLG